MDPLSSILQRAIEAAPGTPEGSELLRLGAVANAKAADSRQADVAAARDYEADRQEARQRYIARAANLQGEHAAEQSKSIALLLKLSSKTSLEELATRHAEVNAKVSVIGAVIKTIDAQLADARKKVRASELALLIAQREWCDSSALEAGHRAFLAMAPILREQPNTIVDLTNSSVSKYVIAIADLDAKISTMQNQGQVN